ncbi:glycerol-3-phosphate dehydrogenase [Lusitaniella coriacea]|uniref:glycerol-3-phosphate dehydrogenase n=1 Tax=Lusitaniella coriacea TaxID=1983105 RepID=UPI003CE95184
MRDFSVIERSDYDLIVIGGGINGAGTARDGALRGLKTLLVEKGDFAGGTTGWSTRLIHGGLRYLEYFEFNLVRESLKEREILLKIAPHLVKPIQMTIPLYAGGARSYWEIQAGMVLYDLLSFDKTLPNHRMLPAPKMRQLFRAVNAEGLKGAAQYYDSQVAYAERLGLETVLSAKQAGADVFNYAAVTQIDRNTDRAIALTVRDELTQKEYTVSVGAQTVIVNTSGPWVDEVCALGQKGKQNAPIGDRKLGGTKGSHILVDSFPGAPDTALYAEAQADGRPYFIVPWLNRYLIGTTDRYYDGDLDRVKADNEEIDYLIAETNRVIPTAQLSREDVKFTYAGIRPLPYAKEGTKPSSVTRAHILHDHKDEGVNNLISLIGGKLTTYRQVAEELVNAVYRKRGEPIVSCKTATTPLPGAIAPNDPRIVRAIIDWEKTLSPTRIAHLFTLYGARAMEVLDIVKRDRELAEPIVPHLLDIKAQIVYAVEREMAHTLVDLCHHRTTLALQDNYGLDAIAQILPCLEKYCHWDAEARDRAVANYRTYLQAHNLPDYCSVNFDWID